MTRNELVADLEALPPTGRVRRMLEVGRATEPGSGDLLAELRRGNGYERRLALQAAWGSRDPTVAAAGLTDQWV